MTKLTTLAGASLVTLALALPDPVLAQGRARSGSSSGSQGSTRSGPSDSSAGSGGGGQTATARRAPATRPPQGGDGGSSTSTSSGSSGRATAPAQVASGVRSATPADRRIAQPRSVYSRPVTVTRSDYFGRSYTPWYFGSNFGLYNSWRYRYGAGLWGYPYSYPYLYGPYVPFVAYYDPYMPYGYGGTSSYSDRSYRDNDDADDDDRAMGAVRLRANPKHAKVYIDGALVGIVDEFDGLTEHLSLEAGVHQLELRADGYDSLSTEISVTPRKTITERLTLKKRP